MISTGRPYPPIVTWNHGANKHGPYQLLSFSGTSFLIPYDGLSDAYRTRVTRKGRGIVIEHIMYHTEDQDR